jgi:hypothetical protein
MCIHDIDYPQHREISQRQEIIRQKDEELRALRVRNNEGMFIDIM